MILPPDHIEKVLALLAEEYHLTGELTELVAYDDKNYRLDTPEGKKFIVKISLLPEDKDFIVAQNGVLKALSGHSFPKPLKTAHGNYQLELQVNDSSAPLRVFPYFEGKFLAETEADNSFFTGFGAFMGNLDTELSQLATPTLQCRRHDWDLAEFQELRPMTEYVSDPELKRLVLFFFMKHREEVLPAYHYLPKSLIHGDANDWNILVSSQLEKGQRVATGIQALIDFGDMVYSARVHEIAIALAYTLSKVNDKLAATSLFVKAYHDILPLNKEEIDVLYYLIAARLCTILVNAAKKSHEQPGSEYHQVSARSARELLLQWIRINPFLFERELLNTCNLDEPHDANYRDEAAGKISKRQQLLSKSLSLSYKEPIEMLGSALQYMYSADGKTYLDCVNNIPHVGHCHPKVVEAGQKQMARLNTNTRYIYDSLNDYADQLLSTFPDTLSKIFFVNSGSAATDLAVRLARTHTKRKKFLVLDHAYHGNTSSAINLSPYKFNGEGGFDKPGDVEVLRLEGAKLSFEALGFRRKYKDVGEGVSKKLGDSRYPLSQSFAAFIAESIPGCAGQIVLDKQFMQDNVTWIHDQDGLYIADEVQTGFGRVGKHFWAFELYDILPDIVIVGKPMGNGHPMGAVICTDEVAKSFETGMEFFSSFGGNPISCEIGKAVLDVIEDERLQEHAREVGDYLLKELKSLVISHQYSEIREVRGAGLFLGIEFVKSTGSSKPQPDPDMAAGIVAHMKEAGFLLSTDGPFHNVIKIKPPMCFSLDNAKELITEIKSII